MNTEKIQDAIRKLRTAKARLNDAVAKEFPVGADISWNRAGTRQRGAVLNHGNVGRVRVQNTATGKNYWIGMYDVVGYIE